MECLAVACLVQQTALPWNLYPRAGFPSVSRPLLQTVAWVSPDPEIFAIHRRAHHEREFADVRRGVRLFVAAVRRLSQAPDSVLVTDRQLSRPFVEKTRHLLRVFFVETPRHGHLRDDFGDDCRFALVHDHALGENRQLGRLSGDLVEDNLLGDHHDVVLG